MKALEPALWLSMPKDKIRDELSRYGQPCPYFRKEFTLPDKEIVSAELQATAVGVFKAYINGKEADGDYMSPGYTDYTRRIPQVRYDVTNMLAGQNAIVIVAGDGWATGYMGNAMYRQNYAKNVMVAAKLTVKFIDGTKEEIITDSSWLCDTDEIVRTDNYMGEFIDHNLSKDKKFYLFGYDYSQGNWRKPEVSGNEYLYARVCEEIAPRIRVKHILKPEVLRADDRIHIYDMKQNMVGVIRLVVRGTKGTRIYARYGEMLEKDGTLYTENLRRAECTDTFFLSGNGEEEFRPLFTFHGFRYVELRITGSAEVVSLQGEVMYSDLNKTAEWSCSDELLNQVYSNIVWGQRGNFLSVPTDCPQRDERLGWTGDAQIFCGTAMFNMDCEKFYEKYIQDLIDTQRGTGTVGIVAPVVPHARFDETEGYRPNCAGWEDAIAVIPYEHYLMYGNKKIIKDTIYFTKRFIDAVTERTEDYIRPAEPNYGDWLNVDCETEKSLFSTTFYALSTMLTAKMCEIIGDDDATKFRELYANIKNAFRNKFYIDGRLTAHTQTAYILAYKAGLLSAEEIKEPFMDTISAASYKLTTGFLGTKHLLEVLTEVGRSDVAYKILTGREYPGWCYSALNGATTIWERWNGYTHDKGFGDVGMNSFNHYSFGACGEWMFRYCLGIMPVIEGAGFEKLLLKPCPDTTGKLTHAEGYYDSKKGRISARWEITEGVTYYYATVPAGIDLTVDVPEGVKTEITRY